MVHSENSSYTDESRRFRGRFWPAAGITALNALTSAGFATAGLVSVSASTDQPAKVFAMYAAARSIPLAVVVLGQIALRNARGLATLAWVMTLVQACDALVGVAQQNVGKAAGPAVFAVLTALAAKSLWSGSAR
jgi:hypothetical protein